MIIFYKCSFRASHGFGIGKYNTDTNQLSYISEKSEEIENALPKTVEYTLSHQLGRCLLLATDENGNYFLGVYRLIEGNDDKYVNAIFYDCDNPQYIIALYEYFCSNQKSSSLRLLESVQRASSVEYDKSCLEFTVRSEIIKELLNDALSSSSEKETKKIAPNSILAFITTDEYDNYQIAIEDKFSVNKMFLCEKYNTDTETITDYQLAIKNFKTSLPILLPVAISSAGVALALIIAFLILLL